MKGIDIPSPCGENWHEMTPTQQGAFCSKCSVNVVDFSNKPLLEIKQLLKTHLKDGHMCGRIKSSQLDELNQDYQNWKRNQKKTFQSKFLLALLIGFGLSLFSCNQETDQAIFTQLNNIVNTVEKGHENALSELEPSSNKELISAATPKLEFIPADVQLAEMVECHKDTTYQLAEVDVVHPQIYNDHILGGAMIVETVMISYLEAETVTADSSSTLPEIDNSPVPFESLVYPNPTNNLSTLALDIKEESQFEILLYSMSGQLVRQIHSGLLSPGRQTFEIDLQDQNSGVYLIKVQSLDQNETIKITKTL